MAKTIITAALTGAVTPAGYKIPETPQQIADEAYDAWKLGAAVVHLHMRADDGVGANLGGRLIMKKRLIRSHKDCDVIINCTSSGASPQHPATDEERMAHHKELPGIEMGSYDAGSFNWMPGGVFINSPQFLQQLGDLYMEKGTKPEIEIFDNGMIGNSLYYINKYHIPTPCHFQFVLGVGGGADGTVRNLNFLREMLPEGSTWSVTGIGKTHLPMLLTALAMGADGVRVGLEDNLYLSRGVKATNVQLVERAAAIAKLCGREIATAEEARAIWGIKRHALAEYTPA